ncbi:glutathione S-transferase family protein [Sphingomonas sp.]|uniref:glutathione S-transferase family protein n=1 Tax=Sphingomonas sp. TaxID=28214 RepID=UPI0035B3F606
MDLILYGNRESGHSYKVRLALTLMQAPHEYRPVDISLPREQRPAEFRRVSRFGEVPVLVDRSQVYVQSDAILLHLAQREHKLYGRDAVDHDQVREWLFWEANRIGISVPNLRFALRWLPDTPKDVLDWLRQRALADLGRLNDEFAKRQFLLGDFPTVADIACCGYLFWLDQAELDRDAWPNVSRWLSDISALPGWQHPYDLM